MSTAFQPNAFQSDAFQEIGGLTTADVNISVGYTNLPDVASLQVNVSEAGGAADDGWIFSQYRAFNKKPKKQKPKLREVEPEFAKILGPNLLAQFEAPSNPVIRPEIAARIMAIARPEKPVMAKLETKQPEKHTIAVRRDEEEALLLLLLHA